MYPDDHPYNWQVIGSLADLDAATLQDVKDFYGRWYVPNNVTVTISGDFDIEEAKGFVEKYFGEIPRGPDIAPRKPRAAVLEASKSLFYEDNFATQPRLTMVWPAVEQYHVDAYALDILSTYLTEGKRAPFNEVLIDEEKLTTDLGSFYYGKELAGEFYLYVTANTGEDLDGLTPALEKAFLRFEENGISEDDLARIKAGLEASFYGQVQSALGKAIQLGEYNLFTGDPGFIKKDIENILAVTTDDVMRVYKKYIKDRARIYTSVVPKNARNLVLDDVMTVNEATIIEEPIVQGAEAQVGFDPTVRDFDRTASSFDRTVEPGFGDAYELPVPTVWRDTLGNNVDVYGIENSETPLIYFSLNIDAGRDRTSVEKPSLANLTAELLLKGTKTKTTAELEDAIKALGSSISVSAGQFGASISGNSLARNFDETIALVEEILTEPRWDNEEFDLLKRRQLNAIEQAAGEPNAIAVREGQKLLYPDDHIFSYQSYGTKEKLEALTLEDLKGFFQETYVPAGAKLSIVGDVDNAQVTEAFSGIVAHWKGEGTPKPQLPQAREIEKSTIYFYDVPGAKQSVLRIQRPTLNALSPDYPKASAVNFLLGDIYTSRLNTELRVNKGYTYGIRSGFNVVKDRGVFRVSTNVRSNVTRESIETIRAILADYGPGFTEEDLGVMKSALLRGQALQTETLSAKLGLVGTISTYGYPDDYLARNAALIEAMTLDEFKAIADTYLRPDAMDWLVVGDAATQAARLGDLGFGDPVMLEKVE